LRAGLELDKQLRADELRILVLGGLTTAVFAQSGYNDGSALTSALSPRVYRIMTDPAEEFQ
jgi:hypothetical protein